MRTIGKFICTCFALCVFAGTAKADLEPIAYIECGYGMLRYKSDELPVFLASYNAYQNVSQPFRMNIGAARGPYVKFGVGIGATCRMVLDFTIYKAKTPPLTARFADGTGRDIWAEHRLSNTIVGIRFGDTKEVRFWGQFNINIAVQASSLYSAYVYADGSRSLGTERNLNGVYSNHNIAGGLGLAMGYRIIGPLGISIAVDRIGVFERKKSIEYHKYTDLNNVKPDMQPDYIPRDMAMYVSDPYNSIENSIGNDFRGWKITAALTFSIGNWGKE